MCVCEPAIIFHIFLQFLFFAMRYRRKNIVSAREHTPIPSTM